MTRGGDHSSKEHLRERAQIKVSASQLSRIFISGTKILSKRSSTTALAATKTTIRVTGMKCNRCASSVAKALKATAGVREAEVSSEKGQVVLTYDDEKLSEAKLRGVVNGTGFKVAG